LPAHPEHKGAGPGIEALLVEHDALLHEVPNIDLVTIPNAGHYPQLTRAETVASVIDGAVSRSPCISL
jgi:pimeloyl-ACP methyl ester carboxylesterase